MAKFLITAWPVLGHINPCLAIAHALGGRGHEVAIYTGEGARAEIEQAGVTLFPFRRVDGEAYRAAEHPQAYAAGPLARLQGLARMKAGLRAWLVDTLPGQVDDLNEVLPDFRPDLILTVESLWAPLLVLTETRGMPVAVLSTFIACLLPGPDAPAWGGGAPPPHNALMRLQARALRGLQWWLSADFRRAVNELRRSYGLEPLTVTVTEHAGQMPLYLMPSVPELDYGRRDLPPSVRYVGPCTWDKPPGTPPPDWLATLPPRALVHVTEATVHHHQPLLLRAAAEALGGLPIEVVMTTGRHRDPATLNLGPLAPNIRVERYVPHSDLMPHTDCLVTLGGAGTVMAALRAGVPLVVVPTEWDKPENAARVQAAGAGIRLDPRRLRPRTLRAAVERVLTEPSFRHHARRLAASCARHGGAAAAAGLLESLAVRPGAGVPS